MHERFRVERKDAQSGVPRVAIRTEVDALSVDAV